MAHVKCWRSKYAAPVSVQTTVAGGKEESAFLAYLTTILDYNGSCWPSPGYEYLHLAVMTSSQLFRLACCSGEVLCAEMDHKRNQQCSHKDAASESSDVYRVRGGVPEQAKMDALNPVVNVVWQ
ncbi:hypothetical protein INS49_011658 [Diaporthe citri]|uniref:uncharacterized protein n=1 Tax=Diaporthe citri TaxID=83186 RepID=UPI001C8014F3|nr:uncharacterized protein INS49_011658 [Diaporthe citri]KAG6360596.1 hypothetical protein INS49_011658 [Diaporthe citri]